MSKNNNSNDTEKLGHDPLEWLQEEGNEEDLQPIAAPAKDNDVESVAQGSEEDSQAAGSETVREPEPEDVGSNGRLSPESSLTVQYAESLHQQIMAAVQASSTEPLAIDLSQVTHVDSSGYQLLISAFKTCQSESRSLRLSGVKQELVEQFRLLGDQTLAVCMEAVDD
ncbi:STAS domain-containing protein [Alteromonas flava]|uniref:STAS domain-containing protein n=1 Tax=Alteromonas flava TaxID=2048003 RepID=UPI000C2875D9|nr:STAS domain-containing protein [Alteromonas flava]